MTTATSPTPKPSPASHHPSEPRATKGEPHSTGREGWWIAAAPVAHTEYARGATSAIQARWFRTSRPGVTAVLLSLGLLLLLAPNAIPALTTPGKGSTPEMGQMNPDE
jgi:hypothetical protein